MGHPGLQGSGKALGKGFGRRGISFTLLPEKKQSRIYYFHILHIETGFVFQAIHSCYFKLLSSELETTFFSASVH